jgi:Carboxypeptidase regulatory-like domain
MRGRDRFAASLGFFLTAGFLLAILSGCGRVSPASPTAAQLMVTGYVYQRMIQGSGEPPIADALVSLRNEDGVEFTARSDERGFYRIRATAGEVVMTAAKEGYTTRESRFDVTDSTVLNFGLAPVVP